MVVFVVVVFVLVVFVMVIFAVVTGKIKMNVRIIVKIQGVKVIAYWVN